MNFNDYLQPERMVKLYGGCAKSGTYLLDGAVELIVGIVLLFLHFLGKTSDLIAAGFAPALLFSNNSLSNLINQLPVEILLILPFFVLGFSILLIISGILKLISGSQLKNTRIRLFETYIEAEYYKKTLYGLSRRMMSAKYQEIEDIYNKSYTVFIKFNKKKIKIWASDKYAAEKIVSMVKSAKMAGDANVLL